MKYGTAIAVLVPLFAVGCAQTQRVKVTYRSDPPGGALYKLNGELWGPCPKVLWYDLDAEAIAKGYFDAKGLMVRWPSGPEKRSGELVRISLNGTNWQVTFAQHKDALNTLPIPSPTDKERAVVTQAKSGQRLGQREERPKERVQIEDAAKIIDLGDGVTMEFVLIPAGEFMMNSPSDEKGGDSDEGPMHRVRISKLFYMGMYEVTQEQYEKVMKTNPSGFKGPKRPVETVSWDDAQEFCRRLSTIENGRCRLPTEAEWEYACRAGTTTAYYWGGGSDARYAWSSQNSGGATHDVGTLLPNAWGLHGMGGNVREWCEDWYGKYNPNSAEQIDPKGPSEGNFRVLRGGAWCNTPVNCRSAHRYRSAPGYRNFISGFRIVLDLK